MLLSFCLILLSLVLLYFGADWLVKGSASLAFRFGISALVIGLTVVAFGTSAPELTVSLHAALNGQNDISIGNITGSNIINICCILGISAFIRPMKVNKDIIRIDLPVMIAATVLFLLFFINNELSRLEGGILFAGIILYLLYIFYRIRSERHKSQPINDSEPVEKENSSQTKHWAIDIILIGVGLTLLIWGARLLVDNAVIIATRLGMSQSVIGMTVVALGTSLPELATSVVAAIKKRNDIAIGNIVGSNIFNILAVLGSVALISPIRSAGFELFDKLFLLGVSVLLFLIILRGKNINRVEGLFLFMLYIGYTVYIIASNHS